MIPYARQDIDEADVRAVVEVLNSDWLTQGPAIERFESAVAAYCGARYAVAVCNATAALHLSCLAAGLKPGGLLWTSPNTFVASANCALYCGGKVDFVDIDAATCNLSVAALKEKLAQAEQRGSLPDVLIPVHFAGQSCEMEAVAQLARRHGIAVIEDASHAIGGRYRGGKIGDCRYSDMTVLSFHAVKIITGGEGGMILTNREDMYGKLLLLRSHGIVRDPARMVSESHGPWYYQQIELGYNYRMTDIQAALGASQMNRLDEFVGRRNHLARRYDQALRGLPLRLPAVRPDCHSAYHLYVVQIDLAGTKATRRQVFDALRNAGIGANVHYIPVHTQPYYQRLGFRIGDFPEAEGYYSRAISLPLYYSLTEADQDFVIAALEQALA